MNYRRWLVGLVAADFEKYVWYMVLEKERSLYIGSTPMVL